MTDNDYLWPGFAAIALAALTPGFWVYVALSDYIDGIGYGLVLADWFFVLIVALTIYVYYSFKQRLHDHHNFHDLDILVVLFIGVNGVLAVGGISLELLAPLIDDSVGESRHESILTLGTLLTVSCTVAFGVIDILIGIVLMRNSQQLPDLLKILAVVSLIQGIFELTILFSFFSIAIFPITSIVLAVYFLRKPQMIEVV